MKDKPTTRNSARFLFGKNMRTIRRLRDISQENLAFEAGVSRAYISDVEKGKRAVSIDVMEKIAFALDISLENLLKDNLSLSEYL